MNAVAEKHKKDLEEKKRALEEAEAKRREEASQIKPGVRPWRYTKTVFE